MTKPALLLFAALLTGCASTSGWRALSIDGSTQATFEESVASLQQALPQSRRQRLNFALADIWVAGTIDSALDGSGEYEPEEYFAQLDGLGYRDVIDLATARGSFLSERSASTRGARKSPVPAGAAFQGKGFTANGGGYTRGGGRTDIFDPSDWRPCC